MDDFMRWLAVGIAAVIASAVLVIWARRDAIADRKRIEEAWRKERERRVQEASEQAVRNAADRRAPSDLRNSTDRVPDDLQRVDWLFRSGE